MRLLKISSNDELSFTKDFIGDDKVPPYAILSHTWQEGEEVTYDDRMNNTGTSKAGNDKIIFCVQQAKLDGLEHFWVDTCCINKADNVELQDAINSMFRWYQNADQCYVYLSDVSTKKRKEDNESFQYTWEPAFLRSRWFTRGWTLQELLAPPTVTFYSLEGNKLGDKKSLEQKIHEIIGIAIPALQGTPLHGFSVRERLSWSEKRHTLRKEDKAYSLLGIFGISMPSNYGEGEENAFKRLHKEIRESSGANVLSLNEEQKKLLMDSLRFNQINLRQMSIKKAHAKTCTWLLCRPEYLDWLDANKLEEHHGFLWIKGKPGTGKSTLMKFALLHARKMKDKIVISFFFNARGEDIEKSTVGTYRSLLVQLLEQLPALQSVLSSVGFMSSCFHSDDWSVELLETLLEQVIEGLGDSSVLCYIDALDECDEEQIRSMLAFFERIGELAVAGHFRVCFSSRHYPHIKIRKGLSLVLEGQEGHSQDITNYLKSELDIGQSKIAQKIRTELQEKASGIFMWVVLVVSILNKEYDHGRIHTLRQRLQEIPGDLHKLFHDLITRGSDNRDELLLCIQWILFAKRPLAPEELYYAIRSGAEVEAVAVPEWVPDEITTDMVEKFILSSSKGLAEITASKDKKVQFIHESVRDFLLRENGLGNICPNLQNDLQGQSHEQLKLCCFNYMKVDVDTPLNIPKKLPKASSELAIRLRKLANDMFPFLEYAVQNVLYHADMAEASGIKQATFVSNFPLARWIRLDNFLRVHEVSRHSEEMPLIYILAERNMGNLIRGGISVLSCLEEGKERYGPPLSAAMAAGSIDAVGAFIETFYEDQFMKNFYPGIFTQEYWDKWNEETFGRDFKFPKQRGVLSYLAELGNETMVKLFLDMGRADVESVGLS